MVFLNRSRAIRLVASVDSPLVNECFDRYPLFCRDPGFEAEFSYTVVHDLLKLPVEWIRVDSYSEMERYLNEGLADMIGSSMMVDPSLGNRWGYSPPYIWDGVALFVKETVVDSSESTLLIHQFTKELWGTMILGTLLIVIIHWVAKKLHKRYTAVKQYNRASKCLNLAVYFFNNLLYAFWFLFISIMLNFYGNLMAVDLLHSSKQLTIKFNSMDELGDKLLKNECRLALYDVYSDNKEFLGTVLNPTRHNRSWAQKFRDAYKINKPIFLPSREELAALILNDSCTVGLDWVTIKKYFTSRWCNLRMITYPEEREMFYQYTFYTTLPELRDAVNTVIDSDAFQAFPDILTNKYYFSGFMPNCENIETVYVNPLTLGKLQDGFYVLLTGIVISLSIVVYQMYKRRRIGIFKQIRLLLNKHLSRCYCNRNKVFNLSELRNFKL